MPNCSSSDTREVHAEAEPYHKARFGKTVDFDDAVVEYVGDGKYYDAGRNGERTQWDGLDFHKIAHDETHAECDREQQEGD